jgi:hypothetical protein
LVHFASDKSTDDERNEAEAEMHFSGLTTTCGSAIIGGALGVAKFIQQSEYNYFKTPMKVITHLERRLGLAKLSTVINNAS